MTKIKICGLTRSEDIAAVNRLMPDYIGFVFAKSRRQVTPAEAKELRKQLKREIQAVGIFVNENPETVAAVASCGAIDLIQLHGDENAGYCCKLRTLTSLPIIKAIRIKDEADLTGISAFDCDYYLFDTLEDDHYGGTGKAFRHECLLAANMEKPFFLAGGLDPDNVAAAVALVKPFGVDTSSGVETSGIKDAKRIEEFIRQGRKTGDE